MAVIRTLDYHHFSVNCIKCLQLFNTKFDAMKSSYKGSYYFLWKFEIKRIRARSEPIFWNQWQLQEHAYTHSLTVLRVLS